MIREYLSKVPDENIENSIASQPVHMVLASAKPKPPISTTHEPLVPMLLYRPLSAASPPALQKNIKAPHANVTYVTIGTIVTQTTFGSGVMHEFESCIIYVSVDGMQKNFNFSLSSTSCS